MDNKIKKIIGWVLLVVGLLIIFADLYQSINIFTGKVLPPSVFSVKSEAPGGSSAVSSPQDLQRLVSEQISKIIPSDYLSKMMDLISWSIFASILVLIGGKVSMIGIGLLREKAA